MSLATWKAIFYPEEASAAAERGELAAVEHSIRKWEGATPENLKAHGLAVDETVLQDDEGFEFNFDSDSCALCVFDQGRNGADCVECAFCAAMLAGRVLIPTV